MVEITISGAPGSGTSTLVRRICAEMGWRSLNGGDVFRAEAERRDLSVHDFSELCKNDLDVDRSLDLRLKQAMTDSTGPEVLESRLSGWWAHRLDIDCIRVWIDTSDEERARRVQNREGGELELRLGESSRRQAADKARYRSLYDIDLDDMTPYTLVIDANDLSAEEVYALVETEMGDD